jgi:carbamoyl-phosphate synthase large subunit
MFEGESMATDRNKLKIFIPGAGPVSMGQGNEYDGACVQAMQVLRQLGHRSVVVDANPATRMTDGDMADSVYLEPMTLKNLIEIIEIEKPDAILTGMGGALGLHRCSQLVDKGICERFNMRLLGASSAALAAWSQRTRFIGEIEDLGLKAPESHVIASMTEAKEVAARIGFPLLVRSAAPTTPMDIDPGCRLVYNLDELQKAASTAGAAKRSGQIILETSLEGYQEIEFIGLRDGNNRTLAICLIENVDALGIHGGDSICVTPPQTIPANICQKIHTSAFQIMEKLAIVGCASIRYAYTSASEDDFLTVVGMTPGMSRSAAMASMVNGVSLAATATRLMCGHTIEDLPHHAKSVLQKLAANPSQKRLAVRVPHWDFERFEEAGNQLGPQMQSTGEAVSIAASYPQALSKAMRTLGKDGFDPNEYDKMPKGELLNRMGTATSERQFIILAALKQNVACERIAQRTHIHPWFIDQMKSLATMEVKLREHTGSLPPDNLLISAKQAGFSDNWLARILKIDQNEIRTHLQKKGCGYQWLQVNGEFDPELRAAAHYAIFTADIDSRKADHKELPFPDKGKKILLVGPGPNHIGLGAGIDHTLVHVARTLKKNGHGVILANADALSHAEDPEVADRYYFTPITLEDILEIYTLENPDGILLQFGGKAALALVEGLAREGAKIIGTHADILALSADPFRLKERITSLGIPQPESSTAVDADQAAAIAENIGYPIVIRSKGTGCREVRRICVDRVCLQESLGSGIEEKADFPVTIEQFLEFAIEIEVDALGDGEDIHIPAVMEQMELAGVHFGNSACVTPPYSTAPRHIESILEYSRKIAVAMGIEGLFKLRFCYYQDTVYLLEIQLGSSRTVPVISRISKTPMAAIAAKLLLGAKLRNMELPYDRLSGFAVREAVLPFGRFPHVDPVLGSGIQSTGEVLAMAESFGMAYYKSQEAIGSPLPVRGIVLITVTDEDKPSILEPVRLFKELGFTIKATQGTHEFLTRHGIEAQMVRKLGFGRPDLLDEIKSGKIDLVINTPSGRQSQMDDSYIRKAAITYQVPNITTPAGAVAAAKGIVAARRQETAGGKPLQEFQKKF